MTPNNSDLLNDLTKAIQDISDRPIDPTANVLQLVSAAMTRQDDLRELETKYRLEIRELETKYRDAQQQAEKERINAQRGEDKAALALATQRAESVALQLADQVKLLADTLAKQVEATRLTLETATKAIAEALGKRIDPLEQARYQAAGGIEQKKEGKSDNRYLIGLAMSIPSWLLAIIALVYAFTKP